jgi:hypothetical protein
MRKEYSGPLHSRGMPLHARGQRVPDFEFPNSESGMGYGAAGTAHEQHMSHRTSRVSPGRTLGVLGGRAIGKEGRDRRDTGSGQQKAPRGNLGVEGESGRLSTVAR